MPFIKLTTSEEVKKAVDNGCTVRIAHSSLCVYKLENDSYVIKDHPGSSLSTDLDTAMKRDSRIPFFTIG